MSNARWSAARGVMISAPPRRQRQALRGSEEVEEDAWVREEIAARQS